MVPQISLKQVAQWLKEGYVRYDKDLAEDGVGSIETEVKKIAPRASISDLKTLFSNEKIKGFRIVVPSFKLVDDYEPAEEDSLNVVDDLEQSIAPHANTSVETDAPEASAEHTINEILETANQVESEIFD